MSNRGNTPPRITEKDVGEFFLGPDGGLWRCLLYCDRPSVTFERLVDGKRRGGAVGSPITYGFRRAEVVEADVGF